MRYFILVCVAVSLTGCGLARQNRSIDQYEASRNAYRACLQANPPSACESKRLIMQTDERAMQNYDITSQNSVKVINR